MFYVGGNLLSHTLPGAVPSARAGLASGFGMGTGRFPAAIATDKSSEQTCSDAWVLCQILHSGRVHTTRVCLFFVCATRVKFFSLRVTSQQQVCWLCLFVGVLVPVALTSYNAYRSGLSTL